MRKLAIFAFSFSGAIFAANYLLPLACLWWLAGIFALLGLFLLLCRQKWLLGLVLAMLGCAAGLLCFFLHAQRTLVPAQQLDGQILEIQGQVTAYPQIYEEYCRVELVLEGEGLPHVCTLLYDHSDALANAQPGDMLRCVAKLSRADLRYGERYDTYLSRDLYLTASGQSAPELSTGGFDLRALPAKVNRAISSEIDAVFPADTAAFMKSLMLGDKQDLYRDEGLYVAMSRAGFLHIVAVSGMHIAFLISMIQLLFGKTRRSSFLCLGMIWFFVLVTGSSPSAIRAAIMQSFLLIAPLVRRENDPATSLSAALALILLVNPYSASSVSLQLSFSAMAGILCLADPVQEAIASLFPERWAERLRIPISTAASSLAVLAFSVPFMVWHFGSVALLSPITNILGLWAVSLCFCGGYLSCFLAFLFFPLGEAAAWLISWIARYLFLVARTVSAIPFAVLYIKNQVALLWILLVYLLFAAAGFSRLSAGKKLLYPMMFAALTLGLFLFVTRRSYASGAGTISVIDVGQGQSIAVLSGDSTVVIDCGGLYTLENAGEATGSYLRACGRRRVDLLMLTHLHADHCNGVTMLMEILPVRKLILPADILDEDGMWEPILAAADRHGTEVLFLQEDTDISLGGIDIRLFAPGEKGDANERCMMTVVSLGPYDMLVTGDSSKATERELLEKHPLSDLELLIVGHHGSRYASSGELLGSIGADTAIISVGYNNYGHPTYETLERLDAYGYTIYRTDLNGTVEIQLGDSYGKEK